MEDLPECFFEVLEAGVEDIFDPAEFGAPDFAHVIKTLIDRGLKAERREPTIVLKIISNMAFETTGTPMAR